MTIKLHWLLFSQKPVLVKVWEVQEDGNVNTLYWLDVGRIGIDIIIKGRH